MKWDWADRVLRKSRIKTAEEEKVRSWVDGWMDGWMGGWESRFKDCLTAVKNCSVIYFLKIMNLDMAVKKKLNNAQRQTQLMLNCFLC